MYACLYAPGYDDQRGDRGEHFVQDSAISAISALIVVAQQFSPRYESRGDLVVIDVRGLERLVGSPRTIGEELRREAADRGLRVHVAIAGTQVAAMVLAIARFGVVVIEPGGEAAAIASVSIDLLAKIDHDDQRRDRREHGKNNVVQNSVISAIAVFKCWGLNTFGEIAALPADELSARLGPQGLVWQAIARGADARPLVPDADDERFDGAIELEWPIEGLEPLSFVLTRLLEPLSLRLEQRDRGVAVLHVTLRLVTKLTHTRRLELPAPMRDVKTLRTLALLDLEAHPPPGDAGNNVAIDRVAIVIDPTPGRVWQHTLFARPHPTPEQLSTLVARLGATMGQDRIGAPVPVDSHRPGAFEMKPFATEHDDQRGARKARREKCSALNVVALRRCRQPVPARVAVGDGGRPITVTTDRRGFAGGSVVRAAGPWRTSGEWWLGEAGRAGGAGQAGWDRDEWDVSLSDGGAYRVFLDRTTRRWFIDAILD